MLESTRYDRQKVEASAAMNMNHSLGYRKGQGKVKDIVYS